MEFSGSDRYAIRRRLGEGGMGVVYEAFDRGRDQTVALKTLSRVNASGIYRLKRERGLERQVASVDPGDLTARCLRSRDPLG